MNRVGNFKMVLKSTHHLIGLWILSAFCLAGIASGQQVFDEQPKFTEVNPGSDVILTCRIYSKQGDCSWQKDNIPQGLYADKYEWAGHPDRGDCSLKILNVGLDDDGMWQCQVTASSYTSKDALSSKPVRVLVRVAPDPPYIRYNGEQVSTALQAKHSEATTVKCLSRYGNPPAQIRWYLDYASVDEPSDAITQVNSTEVDDPKKWQAMSTLTFNFTKDHHGKRLRCVAMHEAYKTKSREAQVALDIMFAPIIRIEGLPPSDIEENKDSVSIKCAVEANPVATVIWRKTGAADIIGFNQLLEFKPVTREHSGNYHCEARNLVGTGKGVPFDLNVKYPPQNLNVGTRRMIKTTVGNWTSFTCEAEGNPEPEFEWLHRPNPHGDEVYLRARTATMIVSNSSYEHQGQYACRAHNKIRGEIRSSQSEILELQVHGAPQILRHKMFPVDRLPPGNDVTLSAIFCGDPKPKKATWRWGSVKLDVGNSHGKYVAQNLVNIPLEDCYESKLLIPHADPSDSRKYYFWVESDEGMDSHAVDLVVSEQMPMMTLVGSIAACSVLVVAVFLVIVQAFRTERCCFSEKDQFDPSDVADYNSPAMEEAMKAEIAIPPDALYSVSKKKQQRMLLGDFEPHLNGNNNNNKESNGRSSWRQSADFQPNVEQNPSPTHNNHDFMNDSRRPLQPNGASGRKKKRPAPKPHEAGQNKSEITNGPEAGSRANTLNGPMNGARGDIIDHYATSMKIKNEAYGRQRAFGSSARYASDNEQERELIYADLKFPQPRKFASIQRLSASEVADISHNGTSGMAMAMGTSSYYFNGKQQEQRQGQQLRQFIKFGSSSRVNRERFSPAPQGGSSYATNPRGGASRNASSAHDLRADPDISYMELRMKDGMAPFMTPRADV